jgi:hypothetical protein
LRYPWRIVTQAITLTTRVERSTEPLSAEVDSGVVLFSEERGKYYAFDEITTAIWEHVKAPIAVADVCRALRQRFDAAEQECETDVLCLLRDLHARGLITVVTSSAAP